MANFSIARLHVVERAAIPASKPAPIGLDPVAGATTPTNIEHLMPAGDFALGGCFLFSCAPVLVRSFSFEFFWHDFRRLELVVSNGLLPT